MGLRCHIGLGLSAPALLCCVLLNRKLQDIRVRCSDAAWSCLALTMETLQAFCLCLDGEAPYAFKAAGFQTLNPKYSAP